MAYRVIGFKKEHEEKINKIIHSHPQLEKNLRGATIKPIDKRYKGLTGYGHTQVIDGKRVKELRLHTHYMRYPDEHHNSIARTMLHESEHIRQHSHIPKNIIKSGGSKYKYPEAQRLIRERKAEEFEDREMKKHNRFGWSI